MLTNRLVAVWICIGMLHTVAVPARCLTHAEFAVSNERQERLQVDLPGARFCDVRRLADGYYVEHIYPGIDLHVYHRASGARAVEYDFLVHPHADPSRIRFRLHAQSSNKDGSGFWRHGKPFSYQSRRGDTSVVASDYRRLADGSWSFNVGHYDRSRLLVIDPVIVWNKLFDGSQQEIVNAVALDSEGNIVIAGDTGSNDFPISDSAMQKLLYPEPGNKGVFLAKLAADGERLFSTLLDGGGVDHVQALAVDNQGFIYITGTSASKNFPGAVLPGVYVAKLDQSANRVIYAKTIAGLNAESTSLAVNRNGEAYVGGHTMDDLPLEQAWDSDRGEAQTREGFIIKLSDNGGILFSTYLGGKRNDAVTALALDEESQIYLTGYTESTDFPLVDALQKEFGGVQDAFVAKLSGDGQRLLYSTFLGGDALDQGGSIALAGDGRMLITGHSEKHFPLKNPIQRDTTDKGMDAVAALLDPRGKQLLFSSYIGGSQNDFALKGMLDNDANIYVTGVSYSKNYPLLSPLQSHWAGASDLFLTKLRQSQGHYAIDFSSYLGGGQKEELGDALLTAAGHWLLTGATASNRFPLAESENAPVRGYAGFVTRVAPDASGADVEVMFGGDEPSPHSPLQNLDVLVANNGSNNATVVQIQLSLPEQTRILQASTPGFSCFSSNPDYICVHNGLPAGTATRLLFSIELPDTAPHTLAVQASAKEADPNQSNNRDHLAFNADDSSVAAVKNAPPQQAPAKEEENRDEDTFCYSFP